MLSATRLLLGSVMFAVVYVGLIFGLSLVAQGQRTVDPLENLHGVPFVIQGSNTVVTETLAHSDIHLQESVLAKELHVTVSFTPGNVKHLSVGIRQDPFWLSYTPVDLYIAKDGDPTQLYTRVITFPLSKVIQEKDRSIDMMFFADYIPGYEDLANSDTTNWILHELKAEVSPVWPSKDELRGYVHNLIRRTRPL